MAERIDGKIEDSGRGSEFDSTIEQSSSISKEASKSVQQNDLNVEPAASNVGPNPTEEDDETRPLLIVPETIRVYSVVQPVIIIEEIDNLKEELATRVAKCDRPSTDDIACIVQEFQDPSSLYYDDDDRSCKDICCSPAESKCCKPTCKFSFRITQLQGLAVRKGIWRFIQFWSDGLTPPWKLAFVVFKIFIYLCLLAFTIGSFVYHAAERRSVLPFDGISFTLVVVGKIVAVTHAFVFICRHHWDIKLCCKRLCHPIRDRCGRRRVDHDEGEENEHGLREAKNYVQKIEQDLHRQRGKCALFKVVVGNFSEVLLTIVNDAIGTMIFILSFYSFLGGQHYALFYGDLHWSRFLAFGRLAFSSILLLFATHALRAFTVGKNIYRLDKKVNGNVQYLDLTLPNAFSRVMFSFQWRLVAHVALSSVFQLYAIFALSWKIIQDTCSTASPSMPAMSGTSGNSTVLPFMCNIPHIANGYTIYNILYVAIVPTVLGHVTFFICNAPSFVEYMQLIAISSYRQMEKLSAEEHGALEGTSPLISLVKVFCSDLDCSFSFQALEHVEQRARNRVREMSRQLDDDADRGNYFTRVVYKLWGMTFFLPAIFVGTLHLGLFLIHICFMTCTVEGCSQIGTVTVFSIFQHNDAAGELEGVVIPLATLFLLASFPGPWISLFWFCFVPATLAILFALTAVVAQIVSVAVFVLICVMIPFSPLLCLLYFLYKNREQIF